MTQSIFDFLRDAVVHYGYWAVGATLLLENTGVPVPGETILLLASFLAYPQHELQLSWIIVLAIIAATCGDNLGFIAGYYGEGVCWTGISMFSGFETKLCDVANACLSATGRRQSFLRAFCSG